MSDQRDQSDAERQGPAPEHGRPHTPMADELRPEDEHGRPERGSDEQADAAARTAAEEAEGS